MPYYMHSKDKLVMLKEEDAKRFEAEGYPYKRKFGEPGSYVFLTAEEIEADRAALKAAAENPSPLEKSDVEILKEKVAALEEKQAQDELLR